MEQQPEDFPLETNIEKFIETIFNIEMLAFNPEPVAQSVFKRKIHGIVKGLAGIDKLRGEVQKVVVPEEVIDLIDQDLSPVNYNVALAKKATKLNKEMQTKVECLRSLKTNLLAELKKSLPHVYDMYACIRDVE